jgi:hypothetical protein
VAIWARSGERWRMMVMSCLMKGGSIWIIRVKRGGGQEGREQKMVLQEGKAGRRICGGELCGVCGYGGTSWLG